MKEINKIEADKYGNLLIREGIYIEDNQGKRTPRKPFYNRHIIVIGDHDKLSEISQSDLDKFNINISEIWTQENIEKFNELVSNSNPI